MRLISCVLLVCITACSNRKESAQTPPPQQGSAAASATAPGSDSHVPANPVPAGAKPTTERFFKEQYSAFLHTRRGVLVAEDGDSPPEHLCGPAIGTAMVRFGTLANAAKDSAKPDDCKARGAYTYCTFTGSEPVSFVFDTNEVLLAVWIGAAVARASQLEPELARSRECKRE